MVKFFVSLAGNVVSFFGGGSGTACSHVAHAVEVSHHMAALTT